jgi:sulfite reductase beta subunit-like hemoprotein
MRDPIVRVINTAMNVEQGTVEIAAQIGLAAIGAAESVIRLLLPSPAITRRAHEVSEALPWPLDEAVERVAEWPEEEQAA